MSRMARPETEVASLDGRVVVITGGAGAIGLATAGRCLADGASVVLVDRSDVPLDGLPHERVHTVAADVTSPDDSRRFIAAALERFGRLHVLVANAGILGTSAPLTEYPPDLFLDVLRINVHGTFLTLQAGLPHMADGGSVILTASVAGLRPVGTGTSAYVAAKHAVIGLMKTAALECAPRGIRVNAVAPGPIDSPMMRAQEAAVRPDQPELVRQRALSLIPLARYGRPEEVAALIAWLAGDDSRYCTGGVFAVDGGMAAR